MSSFTYQETSVTRATPRESASTTLSKGLYMLVRMLPLMFSSLAKWDRPENNTRPALGLISKKSSSRHKPRKLMQPPKQWPPKTLSRDKPTTML